jgi:hypothetical protein
MAAIAIGDQVSAIRLPDRTLFHSNGTDVREGGVIGWALLVISSVPATGPSAQKPVQEEAFKIFIDYEAPPQKLDLAWDAVPIIVRARVRSPVIREPRPGLPSPVPVTEHRVAVIEVLKGAELVPGQTEVLVHQERVEGTAASGAALLNSSDEYVFFLTYPITNNALVIAWGSGGAYRLDAEVAEIPVGARRMWHSRERVPRDEFLNALRAMRR